MKILIIDIETTGFLPTGKICEIGMVELCLVTGEKKIVFNQVINPQLTMDILDKSWICQNEYMNSGEIVLGKIFDEIKDEVQQIVNNYPCGATAFNRDFDVKFLESYGITFPKLLPCPMKQSTSICKLPNQNGYSGFKWPKVEEAYKHFFPESTYVELHRGADDAFHEADIVLALHKLNAFL
jgi:DNA polymerase III epsilon subunit-like protein